MSVLSGLSLPLAIALLVGCAASVEKIEPGEQPSKDSAEGGLWMLMDKAERRLKTSGQLAEDERLQEYVREVACRVGRDYCSDIRVYVVEHPGFNATMAPNGFMTVWTGLLLRTENEAQLAAVLGHEIAHFEHRHTLERWQSIRSTLAGLTVFNMAAAMAGVGAAGDLAALVAQGQIQAYGRDMEREADGAGFDKMVEAGYAPGEAARIWEGLLAEQEVDDTPEPPIFLASHPPTEERLQTLRSEAARLGATHDASTGRERYTEIVEPYRGEWIEQELQLRRFARMEVVIERLLERTARPGYLRYYQGELYRRRAEAGDYARAVRVYEMALTQGGPPETYRGLGFVLWEQGDNAAAREAFENYLAKADQPDDGAMIKSYIEELQ